MKSDSSRVEFVAIPVVLVVLGIVFALLLAADAGVWAWIAVTTILVVLGILAIGVFARRHRHPPLLDAPPTTRRPLALATDSYRVLVVADESLGGKRLRDEVATRTAGRDVEALVIAPALRSRIAHWTGDDTQRSRAESNLAETLRGFEADGVRARGEIGSDDPIQAADDALRTFEADEIVFAVGSGEANWLEQGVVDAARERYDIPVTHIEVDAGS
jgi:GABA permease